MTIKLRQGELDKIEKMLQAQNYALATFAKWADQVRMFDDQTLIEVWTTVWQTNQALAKLLGLDTQLKTPKELLEEATEIHALERLLKL